MTVGSATFRAMKISSVSLSSPLQAASYSEIQSAENKAKTKIAISPNIGDAEVLSPSKQTEVWNDEIVKKVGMQLNAKA